MPRQAILPEALDANGFRLLNEWQRYFPLEPRPFARIAQAVGTVEDSDYGQIPSYAVVNLSTGLRGDYEQGQWDVSLWLKNAFDKTYYTTLWTGSNGAYEGLLGTPRTLGVTGRYDF